MFDTSKLSNIELLDYQYEYLIRHCMKDLEECIPYMDVVDKGLFASELHALVLKYDSSY